MEKIFIKQMCEYKDDKFEVELGFYYDEIIDGYYTDEILGNENLKRIRNEYRKRKNLLTDDEIKQIRNQYKLSQRDFAVLLGFGEVTITRYESKKVQERAHDNVIKESRNPQKFLEYIVKNKDRFIELNGEEKYEALVSQVSDLTNNINFTINQYDFKERGNTEFDISKLKAIISQIKEKRDKLVKTALAKILWYIDCLSYYIRGQSMTGLVYKSMPYGAYPQEFDEILADKDICVKNSWMYDYECYYIDSVESTFKLLDEEKDMIDFVVNYFEEFTAKDLVEYMHKELAYKETQKFKVISYDYAKDIAINKKYKNE